MNRFKIGIKILLLTSCLYGVLALFAVNYTVSINVQKDLNKSCSDDRLLIISRHLPADIKVGDYIGFTPPELKDIFDPKIYKKLKFAKRVKAGPGDHVVVKDDDVLINGVRVAGRPLLTALKKLKWENHVITMDKILQDGEYFMMGEKEATSFDSRYWGTITVSQVIGEVVWAVF